MNESLISFFEIIKNGTYGFESITAFITELCKAAFANGHIVSMNAWFTEILTPVLPYMAYIFLALWALVWLFGKRLFKLIRFIAFFLAGFVLGIYYLADPFLTHFPDVPGWAVGVGVGLALAVLAPILYYAVYSVVVGYGTYLLCISGVLLIEFKGNYTIALIVAVIALLLFLVIHNFVERLGTAFLGAYFMLYILANSIFDFITPVLQVAPFIPEGYEWTVLIGASAILSLFGLFVQQKTKKRKY